MFTKITSILKVLLAGSKSAVITTITTAVATVGTTAIVETAIQTNSEQPVAIEQTVAVEQTPVAQPQEETPVVEQPQQEQQIETPKAEQQVDTPAPVVDTPTVITEEPEPEQVPVEVIEDTVEETPTATVRHIIEEQPLWVEPNACSSLHCATQLNTIRLTSWADDRHYNLNDKYFVYYQKYYVSSDGSVKNDNHYFIVKYSENNGRVYYKSITYKINGSDDIYEFRYYDFNNYNSDFRFGYSNLTTHTIDSIIKYGGGEILEAKTIAIYNWSWDTIVAKGIVLDETKCAKLGVPDYTRE